MQELISVNNVNRDSNISSLKEATNKQSHVSHSSTSTMIKKNSLENQGTNACSDNSDDDVLHVVTNVYTIPIVKSSSAGNGPFITQSNQKINITTSCDEDFLIRQRKTPTLIASSSSVPVVLIDSHFENQCKITSSHYETQQLSKEDNGSSSDEPAIMILQDQPVKSKFQIRSIVEIYENPVETQEKDLGTFKTSNHYEETTIKEIINDLEGKISPLKTEFKIFLYFF